MDVRVLLGFSGIFGGSLGVLWELSGSSWEASGTLGALDALEEPSWGPWKGLGDQEAWPGVIKNILDDPTPS